MPSDGQPSAKAVKELQSVLDNIRRGEDPEIEEIVEAREEVLERYQPIFSRDHLRNLTEEEFQSFLDFENNQHWKNIHRHKNRLTEDMGALRDALLTLTDEERTITDRLTELRPPDGSPQVKYLGKAVITPILLVHRPEEYEVWNAISQSGMKQLDLWPEGADEDPFAESYAQVNRVLNGLAAELDLDLWTLDALWWRVEDLQEPQRREPRVWWVNQGRSYQPEQPFDSIYAPQETQGGSTRYYHENVKRVEPGDVIIHYADTKIRALSWATTPGYETEPPEDLARKRWEQVGWKAEVEAVNLEEPIYCEEIPAEWRLDENARQFDKNGDVNQGYLYRLSPHLARNLRTKFANRWPAEISWGASAGDGAGIDQVQGDAAGAAQESLEAGQGFASSAAVRSVLEEHSMSRAEEYFQGKGFETEDVSDNHPYDLRCENGDLTIHVEVKGTQTDGETVILTANEVEFARDHAAWMVLFVIHSIEIDESGSAPPTAVGGTNKVYMPWDVDEGTLSVINYQYDTPAT